MKSIAEAENHLPFIDGLRGLAILSVMMNHWSQFLKESSGVWWNMTSARWLEAGHSGVTLFFLVSSFTLYRSLERRERVEAFPVRNFYVRRFFRIWPLWLLVMGVYFLFSRLVLKQSFSVWHCFLMLCPAVREPHLFHGTWSLLVEETFYLFFPILFFGVRTVKRIFTFLLAAYGIRLLYSFLIAGTAAGMRFEWALMPPVHWYAFGIGILLCLLCEHRRFREQVLESREWAWLFDVGAGLLIYRLIQFNRWAYTDDLTAVAWAFVFLAAASPCTIIGKGLRMSWMRKLGVCCYSLYLLHPLMIEFLRAPKALYFSLTGLNRLTIEGQYALSFPVFVLLCYLLCSLSFRYLEVSFVSMGKTVIRFLDRKKAMSLVPS